MYLAMHINYTFPRVPSLLYKVSLKFSEVCSKMYAMLGKKCNFSHAQQLELP